MMDMTTLLAVLTVSVGDIEARASAFGQQSQKRRARKIEAKISELITTRQSLFSSVQELGDEFVSVWCTLSQALETREKAIEILRTGGEGDTKNPLTDDQVRAFESQAVLDLSIAIVAIAKAELALIEALDARLGTKWVAHSTVLNSNEAPQN